MNPPNTRTCLKTIVKVETIFFTGFSDSFNFQQICFSNTIFCFKITCWSLELLSGKSGVYNSKEQLIQSYIWKYIIEWSKIFMIVVSLRNLGHGHSCLDVEPQVNQTILCSCRSLVSTCIMFLFSSDYKATSSNSL